MGFLTKSKPLKQNTTTHTHKGSIGNCSRNKGLLNLSWPTKVNYSQFCPHFFLQCKKLFKEKMLRLFGVNIPNEVSQVLSNSRLFKISKEGQLQYMVPRCPKLLEALKKHHRSVQAIPDPSKFLQAESRCPV